MWKPLIVALSAILSAVVGMLLLAIVYFAAAAAQELSHSNGMGAIASGVEGWPLLLAAIISGGLGAWIALRLLHRRQRA